MKQIVQINITQLLCLLPFTFLNLKHESLLATENLFWIVHLKVFTIANPCTLKGIWRVLVCCIICYIPSSRSSPTSYLLKVLLASTTSTLYSWNIVLSIIFFSLQTPGKRKYKDQVKNTYISLRFCKPVKTLPIGPDNKLRLRFLQEKCLGILT